MPGRAIRAGIQPKRMQCLKPETAHTTFRRFIETPLRTSRPQVDVGGEEDRGGAGGGGEGPEQVAFAGGGSR